VGEMLTTAGDAEGNNRARAIASEIQEILRD
jgi:hypothetical protein